jgi:hypothetical protein
MLCQSVMTASFGGGEESIDKMIAAGTERMTFHPGGHFDSIRFQRRRVSSLLSEMRFLIIVPTFNLLAKGLLVNDGSISVAGFSNIAAFSHPCAVVQRILIPPNRCCIALPRIKIPIA